MTPRSLLRGWSAVASCPLSVLCPVMFPTPTPAACHEFASSVSGLFCDNLVFFKGCAWWELTDANHKWKSPSSALEASALLRWCLWEWGANGLVALAPVCRMRLALEPASDMSGITTMAQAMLPREWEGNDPAASRHTPKICGQDSTPQMLVLVWPCFWIQVLAVCHYIFLKFCLHSFYLNQAGAPQPLAAGGF